MVRILLRNAAKILLAIGLLALLLCWIPMKQFAGTRQLDSASIRRVQVSLVSVERFLSRGRRSAHLATTDNEAYFLGHETLLALRVEEEELDRLEGQAAELWIDHFGRVLQVVTRDRTWVDFEAALKGQKAEDILLFALGVGMAFVGLLCIGIATTVLVVIPGTRSARPALHRGADTRIRFR